MNPLDEPPFEKDVLESASPQKNNEPLKGSLSEKDFIRNQPFLKSMPFWVWLFLVAIVVLLGLETQRWYSQTVVNEKEREPFMEVTNRDFSLFLWQFPSYLRVNMSKKTGYLPAFNFDKENFDAAKGEEFVSAPPDLIFLYHTWKRLLSSYYVKRPISASEFNEFLSQLIEWNPNQWPNAPQAYQNLIASKKYTSIADLSTLSEEELPMQVRMAFQGWKNYFYEGEQINALKPTVKQVKQLIEKFNNYSRSRWRNIQQVNGQDVAGLNYLKDLLNKNSGEDAIVPDNELAPFLKVILYNLEHSND